VNKPANGGFTALHMAALNCYTSCVQLLLDLSGNISAVTIQDGMTMDIHKDNFLFKYRLETLLEDLA
jgi:E3 ubiquitin-protein ligase XBAT32/33